MDGIQKDISNWKLKNNMISLNLPSPILSLKNKYTLFAKRTALNNKLSSLFIHLKRYSVNVILNFIFFITKVYRWCSLANGEIHLNPI